MDLLGSPNPPFLAKAEHHRLTTPINIDAFTVAQQKQEYTVMDLVKRFPSFSFCLFILAIFSVQSHASPALADYGALANVQMMSISPDGKMVAFRRHSNENDLLVVVSLKDNKLVQTVDISSIKPRQLYFLDHSRVVMVVSDENRQLLGYRGTHRISTAFSLDTTNGEITQLLTPGDVIYTGQTGLGHILGLSGDGKRVYMPAYVGQSRPDRRPNYSLLEVNLESVRRPRVLNRGSIHTLDYFVDSEGTILAEEIFNNRLNYHSIVAYNDGEEVEIYREETEVPLITVEGLTPDRRGLIITVYSEAIDRHTYYKMSLKDGSLSEPIFERVDADVHRILTDINRVAYGVVYSGLTPSYEFFDKALNQRIQNIVAGFPGQSVWVNDISADWHHIIARVEGSNSSGDYFLYSGDQDPRFLAAARPNISAEDVNPVITYEYQTRDGLTIPTLLTVPLSHIKNPTHLPAVMMPHGGPEAHDWLGFDWKAQALASQGYLVIQPQFRGSTGFGVQHQMAGRGEWGKKMQDDLTDGLKQLIKEKLVDPERTCIVGSSYGGYAALMAGALTPELYQCVVSINGVSDISRMLREGRSKYGRDHWVLSYWGDVTTKGEVDKGTLAAISPISFAEKFSAPVLLVHSDQDKIVDSNQSRRMYRRLKRAKKPVELVRLRGEDHFLSGAETRMESLEAVVQFVHQHIGQASEADEG